MTNSLQLAASQLRLSKDVSHREFRRRWPERRPPCVFIFNKANPQVTLKPHCKTLSSSFSGTRRTTIRWTLWDDFSRPTPSVFTARVTDFQPSRICCFHERSDLEAPNVPNSSSEPNLTLTEFKVAEEYEIDPEVDVKVATFVYKEEDMLSVRVSLEMGFYQVELSLREEGTILHWAVDDWSIPDQIWWPHATTKLEGNNALETSFTFVCQDHWEVRIKVLIRFPDSSAPKQLVFVLRDKLGVWYNNGGFFSVMVKPLEMKDLLNQIVVPETNYSNWSLFNRFILAARILDSAETLGGEGMALVFTWLRLSANKQLGWYRHSNYQPKDMAHVQKRLASVMAEKVKKGKDSTVRLFARMALATLPRGGGDSEQIRIGILNIMREHGIREGHRPGLEERFLEQWHQKLHTNTTLEDVYICEAYLSFLHTNRMDSFYTTLRERGVTKQWLENMDHPINSEPLYLPQLIPAVQNFLWVLKTVHSGADLDVAMEMSKDYLDNDLKGLLYHILGNRNTWWIPGKVVEARKLLEPICRAEWSSRDVLLLDVALDSFFALSMSRIDKSTLSGDDLCELISLVLENAILHSENPELNMCSNFWSRVKASQKWTQEWGLLALAAVDRISQALQGFMDKIYRHVQPQAESLGTSCGIADSYICAFGEEVVRGQSIFNLSILLQKLQPMLRATACVGTWQIASHLAATRGKLMVVSSLAPIQGTDFPSSRVLVIDSIGGLEDIPVGVTAVLSSSHTDILSHVSIRARNKKVFLASCSDKEEFGRLKTLEGKNVVVRVLATGQVIVADENETSSELAQIESYTDFIGKKENVASRDPSVINGFSPPKPTSWVIPENDYVQSKVGGKSFNIAKLRALLPKEIHLPVSIALPFGTFDRVLDYPANEMAATTVRQGLRELEAASMGANVIPQELQLIRKIVGRRLSAPEVMKDELCTAAESSGLIEPGTWKCQQAWESCWCAICQVWASRWTERAWLSRRSMDLPEDAVSMGCMLQKVVPAEYAFIIHTVHPISKDTSEMFCEVAAGLGEVLAGNHSGYALSFTISKDGKGKPKILSLPSKRVAYYALNDGLIARSDSNVEDLENYAAAGLYDSVMTRRPENVLVDYSQERLLWDIQFREELIQQIRKAGVSVEAAFQGQPQDVEGVYTSGEITVLQARHQIL